MTDLTPTEAAIFSRLEANTGILVSQGLLAYAMTRAGAFHGLDDLRVAIESLREKTGRHIAEVRHRGYVLDPVGQEMART